MFLHKATGQALVKLAGRFVYLGSFGSEEAQQRYRRVVAEWQARGEFAPDAVVLVKHAIADYWKHAEVYYRMNGKATSELSVLRLAFRFLNDLYGTLPAAEFGPVALKACREAMIGKGLCRTTINGYVSRIRQVFRWAVENELVPGHVHQARAASRRGGTDHCHCKPSRVVVRGHNSQSCSPTRVVMAVDGNLPLTPHPRRNLAVSTGTGLK